MVETVPVKDGDPMMGRISAVREAMANVVREMCPDLEWAFVVALAQPGLETAWSQGENSSPHSLIRVLAEAATKQANRSLAERDEATARMATDTTQAAALLDALRGRT